jgi:hypothetical protein
MHFLKYNKVQIIKLQFVTSIKILHVSALECHPQESTRTKEYKSNMPIHVLIILTGIIKIIEYTKLSINLQCCDIRILKVSDSEMWCWRRMKISWTDHVRNEDVLLKSQ